MKHVAKRIARCEAEYPPLDHKQSTCIGSTVKDVEDKLAFLDG